MGVRGEAERQWSRFQTRTPSSLRTPPGAPRPSGGAPPSSPSSSPLPSQGWAAAQSTRDGRGAQGTSQGEVPGVRRRPPRETGTVGDGAVAHAACDVGQGVLLPALPGKGSSRVGEILASLEARRMALAWGGGAPGVVWRRASAGSGGASPLVGACPGPEVTAGAGATVEAGGSHAGAGGGS